MKCFKSLYPLLNRNSKLSLENKLLLYKSIIRPILTYGAPVWKFTAKSHFKKLQIIQNKTLKIINVLPWRFSTSNLHNLSNIPLLNEFIDKISLNFSIRSSSSNYELIRNLV